MNDATKQVRHFRVHARTSSTGTVVVARSLADPEAADDVAAFRARLTRSPQAARDFLQEAGILTPTGRLTRRFGG